MKTLKTVVLSVVSALIGSLVVFQLASWNWLALAGGALLGGLLGYILAGIRKGAPLGESIGEQIGNIVCFVAGLGFFAAMILLPLTAFAIVVLIPNLWVVDQFYPIRAKDSRATIAVLLCLAPTLMSSILMKGAFALRVSRPNAEILQEESLEKGIYAPFYMSIFGTIFALGYLIYVLIFQTRLRKRSEQ